MPNLTYSYVVVAVSALVSLVTQIGICQASPSVTTKGILEFHLKNDGVDLANSSSDDYIALVTEIEAKVKANVTQGMSLDDVAVRIRHTDGLCQVYITMSGDAQSMSEWLIRSTQLPIVIRAEKYEMAVAFDSKGRRYKVATDKVCDVRQVIQPCNITDECTLRGCKLKESQEITTVKYKPSINSCQTLCNLAHDWLISQLVVCRIRQPSYTNPPRSPLMDGNLIVLGYAGAFILALLLIILFCFYRVAYINNRRIRNKKKTLSVSRNGAIQNHAFWAHE